MLNFPSIGCSSVHNFFAKQVPDFTFYRRKSVRDPNAKSSDSADSRKAFSYLMAGVTGTATAYAASGVVNTFIGR